FATTAVNAAGADGLFYSGSFEQVGIQRIAVLATYVYAGIATFIILKVLSLFVPLRVSDEEEETGLDITQHGEDAYSYGDMSTITA
ncbi:MAG: ammonium transporter, partial [Syntrophomonadaceae bacterium]|nr:ammonium transporter [Syntrophomonadaceae bacterium]